MREPEKRNPTLDYRRPVGRKTDPRRAVLHVLVGLIVAALAGAVLVFVLLGFLEAINSS